MPTQVSRINCRYENSATPRKHGELRPAFVFIPFCCELIVDPGYSNAHVAGVDGGVHPERLQ